MKKKIFVKTFFPAVFFCLFLLFGLFAGTTEAAEASLKIPLGISDGAGGKTTLYFGQDAWATAALDPSLGEAAYPPLPPTGVFDARFNLPNGEDVVLDYRHSGLNYNGTFVHQLQYQPGDGQKITIYWNLPSGISGRLQDVINGSLINVSMDGQGKYVVENPGVFNRLKMTIYYEIGSQIPSIPSINFDSQAVSSGSNSNSSGTFGGYSIVAVREPAIKYSLKVESGSGNQQLYFGLDPQATSGLDRFLGEETWPPMPPIGAFDARFNLPGGTDDAIVDYRPGTASYNGSHGYVLNFQPDDSGLIKISWNLPAQVSGNLNDLATGNLINVPMSGNGSYIVDRPNVFGKLLMKINYSLGGSSAAASTQTSTQASSTVVSTPTPTPVAAVTNIAIPVITQPVVASSTPVLYTESVPVAAVAEQVPDNKGATILYQNKEQENVSLKNQGEEKINILSITNQVKATSTALINTGNLSTAEKTAINTFKNLDNQQSLKTAAAYLAGETQPQSRNLEQERAAIKEFAATYKRLPASSQDWNVVRAVAYGDLKLTEQAPSSDTYSQLFYKIYGAWPTSSDIDQVALSYISGEKIPASRSLMAESAAIKVFVKAFHRLPKSSQDWNVLKSLAYSGR